MSIYSALASKGPNGFGYGSTAEEVTDGLDLSGKTILVTGCNSGIGQETMRVLLLRGAHVLGAARTEAKAKDAGAGMAEKNPAAKLTPVACELSEPTSVRASVEAVKKLGVRLDAVVCNAGIMALPKREVKHGLELQFLTNHVGHFLLVTGLLDTLADDGRVVMLSSSAHRRAPKDTILWDDLAMEKGYSAFEAYGQSKMANLLFSNELARRFEGTKRTSNACHPGVIHTNLARYMNPLAEAALAVGGALFMKTIPQGAATQTLLAVHPSVAGVSGKFFQDCNEAQPRGDGRDPEKAKRLWDVTEKIVAGL